MGDRSYKAFLSMGVRRTLLVATAVVMLPLYIWTFLVLWLLGRTQGEEAVGEHG